MSDVPESPAAFFSTYVPAQFEAIKDGVRGKSSAGAMTFRVVGEGEWSLRLTDGALVASEGMPEDTLLQITMSPADFVAVFVAGARAAASEPPRAEGQVFAFKALTIAPDRARLVKAIPGSLAFVVKDDAIVRTITITPGTTAPKLGAPECKIECAMSDFQDIQSGKQLPLQLMMSGKMKMTGNVQIPMALSTVLALRRRETKKRQRRGRGGITPALHRIDRAAFMPTKVLRDCLRLRGFRPMCRSDLKSRYRDRGGSA